MSTNSAPWTQLSERAWELEQGCVVEVCVVAPGKLGVRINSVRVATDCKRVGWLGVDAHFNFPDGRLGRIEMRTQAGYGPALDLYVGEQIWPDPRMERASTCAQCKTPLKPLNAVCPACQTPRPNVAQRLRMRRSSDVSRALMLSASWMVFFGALKLMALRSSAERAMGSLQHATAEPHRVIAVPWIVVRDYGTLALLMLGIALVASRAPRAATAAVALLWALFFLTSHLTSARFSWLACALEAFIFFSLWRTMQVARAAVR